MHAERHAHQAEAGQLASAGRNGAAERLRRCLGVMRDKAGSVGKRAHDALDPGVEGLFLEAHEDAVDKPFDGTQGAQDESRTLASQHEDKHHRADQRYNQQPQQKPQGRQTHRGRQDAERDEHDGGEARVHGDLHEQRSARSLAGRDAATARIVHHERGACQVERGRDSVHEERTEHERQRLARIHVLVDGLEGVRVREALREVLAQLGAHRRDKRNDGTFFDGLDELDQLVAAQQHHGQHDDDDQSDEQVSNVELLHRSARAPCAPPP